MIRGSRFEIDKPEGSDDQWRGREDGERNSGGGGDSDDGVNGPNSRLGGTNSEEVTLLAFRGNDREIEIYIPAVEEERPAVRNYARRAPFLPVAHAVAERPPLARCLSISNSISLPSARLPPYLTLLPLVSFLSSARPRYAYAFPFRTPHMRHKSPVSLPLSSSASRRPRSTNVPFRYTVRPSFVTTFALSSFFAALPSTSFPRICGQFGAAEPPTDCERTRHTAVPTVPSHFEKYPGKMIRPLLRPGLSFPLLLPPPCPTVLPTLRHNLPLLPRLSLSREPTAHRLRFVSPRRAVVHHPTFVAILFPSPKRDAHWT